MHETGHAVGVCTAGEYMLAERVAPATCSADDIDIDNHLTHGLHGASDYHRVGNREVVCPRCSCGTGTIVYDLASFRAIRKVSRNRYLF